MCFVVACVMSWWHGEVAVSHLFGTLDLQFWSGSLCSGDLQLRFPVLSVDFVTTLS